MTREKKKSDRAKWWIQGNVKSESKKYIEKSITKAVGNRIMELDPKHVLVPPSRCLEVRIEHQGKVRELGRRGKRRRGGFEYLKSTVVKAQIDSGSMQLRCFSVGVCRWCDEGWGEGVMTSQKRRLHDDSRN